MRNRDVFKASKRCLLLGFLTTNFPIIAHGFGVSGIASIRTSLVQMNLAKSKTLTLMSDNLLLNSFNNLDETEKYDTVLTGLCAKILDGPKNLQNADLADNSDDEEIKEDAAKVVAEATSGSMVAISEPIKLLCEMNARKVSITKRAASAIIDVAASVEDSRSMNTVLMLLRRNNGSNIRQYGAKQKNLSPIPSDDRKMRERFKKAPEIPTDNRTKEVGSALSVTGIALACFFANPIAQLVGAEDAGPIPGIILSLISVVAVLDNFYDALDVITNLVSSSDKIPNLKLPDKEKLPLGLGSGKITADFVAGFTRILAEDTERSCRVEAAAFYIAYVLGLPCFAFQSNALEGAVLTVESSTPYKIPPDLDFLPSNTADYDKLLTNEGVLKMLAWLFAPVSFEIGQHPQLLYSDPREATSYLDRISRKITPSDNLDLSDRESLLRWAFAETDSFLRNTENAQKIDILSQGLASGASTVGDLVGIIEDW